MKYFNLNYWLRKIYVSKFFQFIVKDKKKVQELVFNSIYKSNHWNRHNKFDSKFHSRSGPGSNPKTKQTIELVKNLNQFIEKNKITSIIDAPCGDCAWFKDIFYSNENLNYLGIDIVYSLINNNNKIYKKSNVNFICDDVTIYKYFPKTDLVLLRDFVVHLPINKIENLISSLKNSPIKFFAINSYDSVTENKEILIGQHRKINLLQKPFCLGEPYYKFNDKDDDNFIYIYKNSL